MGNISSQVKQRITCHRVLALAICDSTYMDPRHLEHFTYVYWTSELTALIFYQDLTGCLVAPQFPIWVSEKEDPDTSTSSTFSSGDSTARGVYVDLAVIIPIIQPRPLEEFQSHASKLNNHNLLTFLSSFIHKEVIAPRCLWVEELAAPILLELKPGPTRHPRNFQKFYKNLDLLLRNGRRQATEQALCLFCSWRFASQDTVYTLAGAGDFWCARRVSRSWAQSNQKRPWLPDLLQSLKGPGSEDYSQGLDDLEEEEEEEDWTPGLGKKMYGLPGDSAQRKAELNAQREEHRNRRAEVRERYLTNLATSANYNDRGLPLFADEAIDQHHRLKGHGDFFETLPGATFFAGSAATEWSRVMRLGSIRSNDYMTFLSSKLKERERQELKRYDTVAFRYRRARKM